MDRFCGVQGTVQPGTRPQNSGSFNDYPKGFVDAILFVRVGFVGKVYNWKIYFCVFMNDISTFTWFEPKQIWTIRQT